MDELDAIRRAMYPASDVDREAADRALERLRERMDKRELASLGSTQHRARRVRLIRVAAIAAIFGVALVFVPALMPDQVVERPTAQAVLADLARTAARQPALVAGPGQYVYTATREHRLESGRTVVDMASWRYVVDIEIERWVAPDGSGRILRRFGEVEFLTSADERAWREAGRPPTSDAEVQDERLDPGEIPLLDLAGLPTEPVALLSRLEERQIVGGPPGDVQTFDIASQLLGDPAASPALRAALFDIAGMLEGVRSLGNRTDPLGREGVAVELASPRTTVQVIVDTTDAGLLATITTYHKHEDVETWIAYGPRGIVSSTGERPPRSA